MPALNLTTLARLKVALGGVSTTADDEELRRLITATSDQIERYLGRHLFQTSRTEQYSLDPGSRTIFLRGYPVTTLTSVKDDANRDFSGSAIDSTVYYSETTRGVINLDKWFPTAWPGSIQVVYTGGMAPGFARMTVAGTPSGTYSGAEVVTDGTLDGRGTFVSQASGSLTFDVTSGTFGVGSVITGATSTKTTTVTSITTSCLLQDFPELEDAALEQLKYRWTTKRQHSGRENISLEGVSVTLEKGDLTEAVQAMLGRHRRLVSSQR